MERLSERLADVLNECINAMSQVEEDIIKAALDRLAAYENTGLTPEELTSNEDVDFARVVELLRADSEGRLVVLPCKVGDTVWIIAGEEGDEEYYVEDHLVEGITMAADHGPYFFMSECLGQALEPFVEREIGKTVFLTREEAEAALAKDNNVPGKGGAL